MGRDERSDESELSPLVTAASALLDPEALAQVTVDHVAERLGCENALLSWWDESQEVLVPLAYVDPRGGEVPYPVFHRGQGLMGAVYAERAPRVVREYRRELAHPMPWNPAVSAVAVPLEVGGRVLGVLAGFHHEERPVGEPEVRALRRAGAQVAPTLSTMRLLAAAQRRTAEARALASLMHAAASAPDEASVSLISEYACRLLGADVAGLVLRSAHDRESMWRGVFGNRTDAWRGRVYDRRLVALADDRGAEPLVIDTPQGETTVDPGLYPFLAAEGVQTALSIPLLSAGRRLGGLLLAWRFGVTPSEGHLELARTLADFATTLVVRAEVGVERDLLVGHAPILLAAANADGVVTVCEGAAAERIGLGHDAVGRRFPDVLADAPEVVSLLRGAAGGAGRQVETELRGRRFDVRVVPRGGGGHVVATDVTERAALAREVEHQATHDELTGLPNRSLVTARTDAAIGEEPLVAVVSDLRAFDGVNETLGFDAGDALLRATAGALAERLPEAVALGRTGGDEFSVVLRHAGGDVGAVGRRVRGLLTGTVAAGDAVAYLEARCGVALSQPGDDGRALLRRADSALQSARRGVGTVVVHDAGTAADHREQLELTAELRDAIDGDALEAHFQPIVDLRDGSTLRLEALARWRHPVRGWIPPATFVELAERAGMIERLTAGMLERVLRRCAADPARPVSMNVSGLDLVTSDLAALVEAGLERHGVAAGSLMLEITESQRLEEEPEALRTLERLAAAGVRIAIDDFGTGWSSYTLLERLPAHVLKLDRTFVGRLVHDRSSDAIVRSAVMLGTALGLEVVAEGIEDEATRAALLELDCRVGQGYLFSPAVPAAELG